MTDRVSKAEVFASLRGQRTIGGSDLQAIALRALQQGRIKGESLPEPEAAPKRSKYNNRKTVVDGITFDSEWEAERYQELQLLERAGHIVNLRLQVPYVLAINGVKICTYVADFVYLECGEEIVEDAKGMLTDVYKLKRRLMKAIYGIEIRETRKQS